MISFAVNKTERTLISDIVNRAARMASEAGTEYSTVDAEMDITAARANGCRLRLRELAHAENLDFAHDVFGIHRHLNRETGRLENHFLPRYAEGN